MVCEAPESATHGLLDALRKYGALLAVIGTREGFREVRKTIEPLTDAVICAKRAIRYVCFVLCPSGADQYLRDHCNVRVMYVLQMVYKTTRTYVLIVASGVGGGHHCILLCMVVLLGLKKVYTPPFVARAFMRYDPANIDIRTVDTILTCTEMPISTIRSDATCSGVHGFSGKRQCSFHFELHAVPLWEACHVCEVLAHKVVRWPDALLLVRGFVAMTSCMCRRWSLLPCGLVWGVRVLDNSQNATKSGRYGDNDGGFARDCRLASQKLWCGARGQRVQGALCMHMGVRVYGCVRMPAYLYVFRRDFRGFGFCTESLIVSLRIFCNYFRRVLARNIYCCTDCSRIVTRYENSLSLMFPSCSRQDWCMPMGNGDVVILPFFFTHVAKRSFVFTAS